MKLFYCLFTLIITQIFSQSISYKGYILKVDFSKSPVDTMVTSLKWEDINWSPNKYESVFTLSGQNYFIKHKHFPSSLQYMPSSYSKSLINYETKKEIPLFGTMYPECGAGIYLSSKAEIIPTENGVFIFNNLSKRACYLEEDKIYGLTDTLGNKNIFHVAGRIDNKYLLVGTPLSDGILKYYLSSLDEIKNNRIKKEVTFKSFGAHRPYAPLKLLQLSNSSVLLGFERSNWVYTANLNESVFVKTDSLSIYSDSLVTFRNNHLFFVKNSYLQKIFFDTQTLHWGKGINLLRVPYAVSLDINNTHCAFHIGDTITVYSLLSEKIVNKFYRKRDLAYERPILDPPYLYIHKIETKTDILKDKIKPEDFHLSQNYPNPFNPSTTIKYTIPYVESRHASTLQHVSLKVYDVLGKEVAALVDEYKQAGVYNCKFIIDHGELSSGIYFYRLQVFTPGRGGSFSETKKLILMK